MKREFGFVFKALMILLLSVSVCVIIPQSGFSAQPIIIDHNATDISQIPESAINQAKSNLHIAYGHTSHGSQLTTGMTGLVEFANNGGLGLSLPTDIFAWNNGGTGGALDLHDYAMAGDVGYYPQWVNETKAYLDDPSHSDVNVIIWSWCGQVGDKYAAGTLDSEYLTPMSGLEAEYPAVTFVYMTGHVDHWDDADNKAANQMIRDYCNDNNKVSYDFADIESYDPDGTYYEFPHDSCDYYESAGGAKLGNWSLEWQDSHTEAVDWYSCTSAHSQPLNANRKAYAAWWLWARLAGWNPDGGPVADAGVEIIGTWDSGIWYWDVAESEWTHMASSTPTGDIAAGDFSGDGKADVASCWDSGLWYQDGDTLAWTKIEKSPPFRVTAGDVTGDGRAEVIGTWRSGIWYWDVAESAWTKMTSSATTGDIAAGDFSGDGKADVASIWGSGLWYQDGATLAWTKIPGNPPNRVTAGDVTGDGRAEIIGTWRSGIWYWDVAESAWTQMTSSTTTGDIAAGDFSGDGKADVASIWDSGLWYQDGATLDWTKIDKSPPFNLTAGQ